MDSFVASVNAALRRTEETARLAGAALRIESYDVVESRDEELEKLVKIHCSLDITTAPMPGCPKETLRTLIREGDLKLRDAATSKVRIYKQNKISIKLLSTRFQNHFFFRVDAQKDTNHWLITNIFAFRVE